MKDNLKWRKIINNVTDYEVLEKIVQDKNNGFYLGVDPTADSLHLGHYISIIFSKMIYDEYGLKPHYIIGGFTGQIGDPSGKNVERELISFEKVKNNSNAIKKQIEKYVTKLGIKDFVIFDNYEIYKDMSIVNLFQEYGKNFNINTMLSRESVKKRIDNGISFTEFSYQVFQAIDFHYLYNKMNVKLQIGGSDQWGNIVSGIELIRKKTSKNDAVGLTVNLLTDENGNKIGKTQGKPIWLDENLTSSYEKHQYFINLSDEMAEKLLSQLTLISEKDFIETKDNHYKNPKEKLLQNKLSKLVLSYLQDEDSYDKVLEISKKLFDNKYDEIDEKLFISITNEMPKFGFENNKNIVDFIIENKILPSKREANDFFKSNAIKINGNIIESSYVLDKKDLLHKKYLVLNIGKKKKVLLSI